MLADIRRISREGPPDMTRVRDFPRPRRAHSLGEVVGEESLDSGVLLRSRSVWCSASGAWPRRRRRPPGSRRRRARRPPRRRAGATTADSAKAKPKRWKAYKGAFFNNPHVNSQRYRIERRLIDTLRHVPKGETVRIALYSFDRIPVANAIIAAHKRGVRIQMLLNDHQDTRAMKMVRAVLGTNRSPRTSSTSASRAVARFADQYRNLHSKFYTFTRAGKSDDVLVVGSHNMTRNALFHQWNDAYFMSGNKELFEPVLACSRT